MRKFWVLISMLVMICMATPAAAVYRGFPLMLCSNETGNPEPCQFMKFAPANSAGLGTLSLLPTASAMYYWNGDKPVHRHDHGGQQLSRVRP